MQRCAECNCGDGPCNWIAPRPLTKGEIDALRADAIKTSAEMKVLIAKRQKQ